MSEPQDGRYDSIARRWLALVERRQQHFVELSATGRWRHYYTEAEFLDEMRKLMRVRDQWAMLAGVPAADWDGAASDEDRPLRCRTAVSWLAAPLWPG